LFAIELRWCFLVMVFGRGCRPVNAGSPFDHIQIQLKHAPLTENLIRQGSERILECLSHRIAVSGEVQILDELLCNRRGTAPNRKRYKFVPLQQISPNLIHAVIAAEDGHFYRHHGIDWEQVEKVAQEIGKAGRTTSLLRIAASERRWLPD
jgi:hypothetical protein